MKKAFKCLLIAALYLGTLWIALMAVIIHGQMESFCEDGIHCSDYSYSDQSCQMPGCNAIGDAIVTAKFTNTVQSLGFPKIENKANFSVVTETATRRNEEKVSYTEKNLYLRPQSDGSYRASLEDDIKTVTSYGDKYTVYRTTAEGYYCKLHKDTAIETVKAEFSAVMTANWIYIWGRTLFPGNLVVLTLILSFLSGLCAVPDGPSEAPWGPFTLTAVIFFALTMLLRNINTLFYTGLLLTTIFGAAATSIIGINIAWIKIKKASKDTEVTTQAAK